MPQFYTFDFTYLYSEELAAVLHPSIYKMRMKLPNQSAVYAVTKQTIQEKQSSVSTGGADGLSGAVFKLYMDLNAPSSPNNAIFLYLMTCVGKPVSY